MTFGAPHRLIDRIWPRRWHRPEPLRVEVRESIAEARLSRRLLEGELRRRGAGHRNDFADTLRRAREGAEA